jgi:hypothetical protein
MKDRWIKIRVSSEEKKLIDQLYGKGARRRSENIRAALLAPRARQLPAVAGEMMRILLSLHQLLLATYRKVPAARLVERLLVLQKVRKIVHELERIAP